MKILIATGGSGGHIVPALNTAFALREQGHTVYFAGVFGLWRSRVQEAGFSVREISSRGFSGRSPLTLVVFAIATVKAIFESLLILRQVKPQRVAGFGGYGAFPVVLAAACLGYPTVIHEQNVVPGKANAVLARLVRKVAISFAAAAKYYPAGKAVLTGCPIRPVAALDGRAVIARHFGLQAEKTTLVLLGGSQGSHRLNSEFIRALLAVKGAFDIQVIHICGEKDYPEMEAQYAKIGIPFRLFRFTDEMEKVYLIADLAISRSGAMTVTELAAFGVRALLVPYPHAGGHQRENALVLTAANAARLIEEKDVSASVLARNIEELLKDRLSREEVVKRCNGIYRPDAAVRLAEIIGNVGPA